MLIYQIIGSDQQPHGPASVEQIKAWIAEGRADEQTKTKLVEQSEWRLLGDFPEFAEALKSRRVGTGAVPVPGPPGPIAKTSGMAIASLVLGIFGLLSFGITALVGLGLGIGSMIRISRSRGALRGMGLAIAGTVVSGTVLVLLPVAAGLLFLPLSLSKAKMKAQGIMCLNNMRQLALGARLYADDNKEQFPPAQSWCDAVQKYLGGASTAVFQCPAGDPSKRCHYAFNAQLAEVPPSRVSAPAQTVLMFEIEGGWNMSGGPELLVKRPPHGRGVGLVFVDGHSEIALRERLQTVRWEP